MDLENPIRSKFLISILRWVDSEAGLDAMPPNTGRRVEWLRIAPFVVLHGMCLGVIWVGWSWVAVATASVLYFVRMFAITGFYHRYFSHKAYQTNRFWQFIFAVLGNSAVQRGPLWWASLFDPNPVCEGLAALPGTCLAQPFRHPGARLAGGGNLCVRRGA